MKIQAADNAGFLALNVNKYVSDHDRCRLIIKRQCSICCNTRWGRVSETRLTRAFSEVTSDAAIGCSSAPPPESTTLTLLHFYRYVIQARLIHRTFHLHVCMLHSCSRSIYRCNNHTCGCAHARLYSPGTFIMRPAEHKYTVWSPVHWGEPSQCTHIQ